MADRLPKAIAAHELDALRAVPKNPRDRALISVMAGCGLRVSEACGLTLDNVCWSGETPSLRFTGKGDKERVVPMNLEVQDALRTWLEERGTGGSPFVFCNLRTGGSLSRKTVWGALTRYARRAGLRHVHPHMLRHTFGTGLADRDVPVERIRELMGHANIETSKVYITVSAEQKRQAVERLDRRPPLARWVSRHRNRDYRFAGPPRRRPVAGRGQTVGRLAELRKLQDNLEKGVDTLVVGPVGVGKSHLLELLRGPQILRVKALNPVRQAIVGIAEDLHAQEALTAAYRSQEGERAEEGNSRVRPGKEAQGRPQKPTAGEGPPQAQGETPASDTDGGDAPGTPSFEAIQKQHARTTVQGWTKLVTDSVETNVWTLVIDDLSDMSAPTGRLIDALNRKFIIIAGIQAVKKAHHRHFWKFERIQLANLAPDETRRLVRQLAVGAEVDDPVMFETYVLQKSAGNPRAVVEIVDRLRKESSITRKAVRDVIHTGARTRIDMTPAVIILALCLIAARVIARGMGHTELYILAGTGAAAVMGIRFFLYRMGR